MKLKNGSLHEKNGWWYLVKSDRGKKRWISLHTRDAAEAQKLAQQSEPAAADDDDERAYLLALVAQGERAKRKLQALTAGQIADAIAWPDLFNKWTASNPDITKNPSTLKKYRVQIGLLCNWAADRAIASPAALSACQAQEYADMRARATVISGRDVALFGRVWRDLHLGAAWYDVRADPAARCETNYRRLSYDEVKRLVATARAGHPLKKTGPKGRFEKGFFKPLPDVADMIALGYHTGLRRGDCARLTAANVDGVFLRVVPEKTSGKKPRPLLIPLQPEALKIVARRLAESNGQRLFPRLFDASLSKSLRMTFERAGVADNAFGRASFHSLRATFISLMDEAGVPPHVTDSITGHAPQGMHGRYTQPGREALMQAACKAIAPLGV